MCGKALTNKDKMIIVKKFVSAIVVWITHRLWLIFLDDVPQYWIHTHLTFLQKFINIVFVNWNLFYYFWFLNYVSSRSSDFNKFCLKKGLSYPEWNNVSGWLFAQGILSFATSDRQLKNQKWNHQRTRKHSSRMGTASVAITRCQYQGREQATNEQVWTGPQWWPPDVTSRRVGITEEVMICPGGVGMSRMWVYLEGAALPCDLFLDTCDVAYLLPHHRQTHTCENIMAK